MHTLGHFELVISELFVPAPPPGQLQGRLRLS
jgi:hypothetical protein